MQPDHCGTTWPHQTTRCIHLRKNEWEATRGNVSGKTEGTIWPIDEWKVCVGWVSESSHHTSYQALSWIWKTQRGRDAALHKITYVSDSAAKRSVFFIGCYRGTFRSRLWFMWIQMIPKLSYLRWFIYEMRQALRLAGEKLSELLLTSATDLTSWLAGCYRCMRLLQFHMCVVEFVVHAKGVFIILKSYWGSVIIYIFPSANKPGKISLCFRQNTL